MISVLVLEWHFVVWSFTIHAWIHQWGKPKSWLSFGWVWTWVKVKGDCKIFCISLGMTVSCTYIISWVNKWIVTKLIQIYHGDKLKSCIDFGYLNLIFKVTGELKYKPIFQHIWMTLKSKFLFLRLKFTCRTGMTFYLLLSGDELICEPVQREAACPDIDETSPAAPRVELQLTETNVRFSFEIWSVLQIKKDNVPLTCFQYMFRERTI